MSLYDQNTGFYDSTEFIKLSYLDWTSRDHEKALSYPIVFLEDALCGIDRGELVVIGADSGCGKTQLASSIAFHNATKGKNVYLFSLEGHKFEIMQREKYRRYILKGNKYLPYRDFVKNKDITDQVYHEILKIDEEIEDAFKTLHIYNRELDLDIDLLSSHMQLLDGTADLLVIDHLHYFDFKSNNEHSEITEIMKQIKKLQNLYSIPIVLVSHLRKKDKNRVFPDQNDFHGSSNIVKQADTAIVISHGQPPKDEKGAEAYQESIYSNIYPTGVRIVKNRIGFPAGLIGVVDYNANKRDYEKTYKLAICNEFGIIDMDRDKYPEWAKNVKERWHNAGRKKEPIRSIFHED